jgi:hypothetical protein
MAVTCAARAASRVVRMPGPGRSREPIVRRGAIASTTLSAHAGARKCWPKRFCADVRHAFSIDSPRQNFSSISSISSSLIPK